MIEACTGPTIGMSGAMAAEGGGGGVVGFVQRHLPLRGEASWGGDPPTPPLSLRGPSGGCCARHPAGLWRTVAFGSQHAGTGGCLHNMTSESGAAEARAAERTGARRADYWSGRGKVAERWRGGGYMSTRRVASTCTSDTQRAAQRQHPAHGERSGWGERVRRGERGAAG